MNHDEMMALVRKHADPDTVDPFALNGGYAILGPDELLRAFNAAVAAAVAKERAVANGIIAIKQGQIDKLRARAQEE